MHASTHPHTHTHTHTHTFKNSANIRRHTRFTKVHGNVYPVLRFETGNSLHLSTVLRQTSRGPPIPRAMKDLERINEDGQYRAVRPYLLGSLVMGEFELAYNILN